MKGTHVSRKTQRKLSVAASDTPISKLVKIIDLANKYPRDRYLQYRGIVARSTLRTLVG